MLDKHYLSIKNDLFLDKMYRPYISNTLTAIMDVIKNSFFKNNPR